MSTNELTHSFNLSADSWLVRAYEWLYLADVDNINTCKLFWAILFSPVALLLNLVLRPIGAGLTVLDDRVTDKRRAKRAAAPAPGFAINYPRQPSKPERIIESIASFMGRVWAKIGTPVTYLFIALASAAVIALVVVIALAIASKPVQALIVIGVALGIIVVIIGVFLVMDSFANGRLRNFAKLMGRLFHSFHNHTCARVVVK